MTNFHHTNKELPWDVLFPDNLDRASVVECQSIPLTNTLDQHLIDLCDTPFTLRLTLNQNLS